MSEPYVPPASTEPFQGYEIVPTTSPLPSRQESGREVSRTSEEDPDDLSPEPEAFSENVYGCASAAIVRDLHFVAKHGGNNHVRITRILFNFLLLCLCVFLQVFLLAKIKEFVTAKSVHDIRTAYDLYEVAMYDADNLVVTENGFHRGLDMTAFDPDNFDKLSKKEQSVVCRIPLTQPEFFFIILFIWSLTVIGEVKAMWTWWICLVFKTKTKGFFLEGMHDCFEGKFTEKYRQKGDDKRLVVHSLTYGVKGALIVFVGLPRFLITGYLLWLGCRWLTATANLTDLIMNAVALEFVLLLKELIYVTLAPKITMADRERTLMLPEFETVSVSMGQMLTSLVWSLLAAGWTYCYMYQFQKVLPMYEWDVREICAGWIKERYSLTAPLRGSAQLGDSGHRR